VSGRNKFIVKKVMECETLSAEVERLRRLQEEMERTGWGLEDKLTESTAASERQYATIRRMEDEFWAEKTRYTKLVEESRGTRNAALDLALLKSLVEMPDPNTIAPFGVTTEGDICNPMAEEANKISTIRAVRSLFGLGLKESKTMVDGWQEAGIFYNWEYRDTPNDQGTPA
jgi:ribosomal protein L7/L12